MPHYECRNVCDKASPHLQHPLGCTSSALLRAQHIGTPTETLDPTLETHPSWRPLAQLHIVLGKLSSPAAPSTPCDCSTLCMFSKHCFTKSSARHVTTPCCFMVAALLLPATEAQQLPIGLAPLECSQQGFFKGVHGSQQPCLGSTLRHSHQNPGGNPSSPAAPSAPRGRCRSAPAPGCGRSACARWSPGGPLRGRCPAQRWSGTAQSSRPSEQRWWLGRGLSGHRRAHRWPAQQKRGT